MSDTTPGTAHAYDPANDDSTRDDRLTVEDTGTTTDPADLAGRTDRGADGATPRADGRAALADDDSIGHVFDQTNGVIEGLDGDSDETAESDVRSASERGDESPSFFRRDEPRGGDEDDPEVTGN